MLKELVVDLLNELPPDGWKLDVDQPNKRYLYLGHPFDTKIVYSLYIHGGSLILATNASRQLTTLELGVPREFWKQAAPALPRPQPPIQGTLVLPNFNARSHEYDHIDPVVYSDDSLSFVNIVVDGTSKVGPLWARICDRCFINICDGYLMSFWIDLTSSSEG